MENIFLKSEFIVIKNLLRSLSLGNLSSPAAGFLNLPCARYQYNYYENCDWFESDEDLDDDRGNGNFAGGNTNK